MAENSSNYSATALSLLKANLGYYGQIPNEVTANLQSLLDYAYLRLAQSAEIKLTPGNLLDDMLQVMYAAWIYRNGVSGAEKHPMLKEAIKDYQLHSALGVSEADV